MGDGHWGSPRLHQLCLRLQALGLITKDDVLKATKEATEKHAEPLVLDWARCAMCRATKDPDRHPLSSIIR